MKKGFLSIISLLLGGLSVLITLQMVAFPWAVLLQLGCLVFINLIRVEKSITREKELFYWLTPFVILCVQSFLNIYLTGFLLAFYLYMQAKELKIAALEQLSTATVTFAIAELFILRQGIVLHYLNSWIVSYTSLVRDFFGHGFIVSSSIVNLRLLIFTLFLVISYRSVRMKWIFSFLAQFAVVVISITLRSQLYTSLYGNLLALFSAACLLFLSWPLVLPRSPFVWKNEKIPKRVAYAAGLIIAIWILSVSWAAGRSVRKAFDYTRKDRVSVLFLMIHIKKRVLEEI